MFELFLFSRGLATGLLLAIILVTVTLSRQHYAGRALMLFVVCVMAYVVTPILHNKSDLFYLTELLSTLTPLTFLLFTQALFEDHQAPARASIFLGLCYLFLIYASVLLDGVAIFSNDARLLSWRLGRLLMFAALIYSIVSITRHWREDLVAPRRLLRLATTGIVGFSILIVVVVETLPGHVLLPEWANTAHTFVIIISTLAFGLALLLVGPSQFAPARFDKKAQTDTLNSADQKEVDKILEAMEKDKLYRDMALSIRILAERLDIPEHRLRKHINTQLEYRNFNDFLNRYRINEVGEKLSSLEMARVPILTIAMASGYRSLSTFNKAFKTLKGVTPKEYRHKHLQNP